MNYCKRIVSLLISAAVIISSLTVCISANTTDELVSVIVELEDGVSAESVAKTAQDMFRDSKVGFSYSFVINGFSFELHASDIGKLSTLDGVSAVYSDTEYAACQADEESYEMFFDGTTGRDYDPDFGKNKVIAIIDSGFLANHEQFTLPYGQYGRLTISNINDLSAFTGAYKLSDDKTGFASSVYKSEKIPFAFDYVGKDTDVSCKNNHGTAMAAIAAGNAPGGSPAVGGAAPAAQLMLMKVFEDNGVTAKTSAVIAALEDACTYGADVINLSLGTPGGFSQHGLLDIPLEDMIAKVLDAGIPVVCSAGNNASLGAGSVYDTYFDYQNSLAKYPDSGTVHTPSTIPDVFSVASANTFTGHYPALCLIEGNRYIPFSDTNSAITALGIKPGFSEKFDGQTFEYIVIPGVGKPEDFTGVDVKGKIALIERGEIPFAEKNNNAAAAGAVAAIIYDNTDQPSSIQTGMQLDGSDDYAVFVSHKDGMALKNAHSKRVRISRKIVYVSKTQKETLISEYSSSGPTPTLEIKPEITAEGESMSVAAASGGYTTMSGTSNSAAYTAGIIAGITDNLSGYSGRAKVKAVKALLMSAAEPLAETSATLKKSYFSVNLQGAGMITPAVAKDAKIIIEGSDGAKLQFGNKLEDKFSATIKVKNLSANNLSFTLSSLIGTEKVAGLPYALFTDKKDPFYKLAGAYVYDYLGKTREDLVYFTTGKIQAFEDASVKFGGKELNIDSASYTGASVTVPAKGSIEITLDFDLSRLDKTKLSKIYENGFFTEGFIMLDGEKDYSIPFLGFVGDFYALSPFAENLYKTDGALFGGCYLYSHIDTALLENEIRLGTNNIERGENPYVKHNSSLAYLSPFAPGSDGMIYLSLSLLRNLTSLKAEVISPSGEIVTVSGVKENALKSIAGESLDSTTKHNFVLWDMRHEENDKYIYDDGLYTCKLT
ncbi:MAG: S8 family serine peptidase, partial [Clostridia bacterium]|nr:S8 family serine peptidase [Clostridia bacterium]